MSYFIDTKYLNMVSHKLPLFAKKKVDLQEYAAQLKARQG